MRPSRAGENPGDRLSSSGLARATEADSGAPAFGMARPELPGGMSNDPLPQLVRSCAATEGASPTSAALDEVSFLTAVNADGTLTSNSYWGLNGETARKWGDRVAGAPGGTVTYCFDPNSQFTATEKATFQRAFALWSSVADVRFAETSSATDANAFLRRGSDGNAYEDDGGGLTSGSGRALGTHTGQALISIDTNVAGFDLSGSFDKVAGYGFSTVVHEIGHLLGLGHGGFYNGFVNPATEQSGPYDERSWTVMSYIYWDDVNAGFRDQYELTGTNWGVADDGYTRESSGTWMPLDILAVQRLYGQATTTPLSGGQVFGFDCNISNSLRNCFDFTINKHPVVTLWDAGAGNTLDLSGFSEASRVNLNAGSFSDAAGEVNNIAIAYGTEIDAAIGGAGDDSLTGNRFDNTLTGRAGDDSIDGGAGTDTAWFNGAAAFYTLTKAGSTYTIVGPDGTDRLTSIEYLQFGSSAPAPIDSLIANGHFAFNFTDARIGFQGASVTVDGPGGYHQTLSGVSHYVFADGTIDENTGSPLVDDLYYDATYRDVWQAHADPEAHYLQVGWREGHDPNLFFSTTGYLAANPDVRAGRMNPLAHFDSFGWHEGRDPSATFDDSLYLLHNPDVRAAGMDPLLHFLQFGQTEGREAYSAIGPAARLVHGSFDPEFYLLANPDVARLAEQSARPDEVAYQHFEQYGWHEGRDPNALFSTGGYLRAYADVASAGVDPLGHYDQFGWREGRDPSGGFDTRHYESAYGDVRAAGVDPLLHYLTYGIYEGRSAFADGQFG